MSAQFTGDDLRNLSYAIDQMSKTTKDTSVELGGYQELQITYQGHVMRLAWQPADKDDSSHGRYALVMPDDPGY